MSEKAAPSAWTKAPKRGYIDLVSPNVTWDAERVREVFLRYGLAALEAPNSTSLVMPPPKAFSPKRVRSGKDLHQHRYVEVGIVTRGVMTIWWEGETARFVAGSVFVIPPGISYLPHAEVPDEPAKSHSVVWLALHRDCAVVHTCSMEGKTHHLSEYYCFTDQQITAQARSVAQELADRSPHYQSVVRGSLLCLFTWLLRAPAQPISRFSVEPTATTSSLDAFSERVKSYLSSNYHRPITLPQIAGSIGCSPAYLCRRFREQSGQSPFQFLRGVRIEAAKRLLISEVPIARVAEMVGVDDPLYFSKVFSGQVGESPQSYRARHRTAETKNVSR